jgi:hypothetical protein
MYKRRNSDHSECLPNECMHRRKIDAEEAQQDREDRLNDEEHRRMVAEARGKEDEAYHADRKAKLPGALRLAPMDQARALINNTLAGLAAVVESATDHSPAELRALRVQSLEEALLEARAAQEMSGDYMGPVQDLRNVMGDAMRLAEVKSESYGDAWKAQGYMGNLARIMSKNARLRNLLWCDADGDGPPIPEHELDAEAVRDTLLDLINLSGFMLLNWEAGNRWGGQA